MREILFRGREYCSKDFVYGDVIRDGDEFSIREHFRPVCHIVIPETVGQYTGLKDKNGKRIFEGDILILYRFGYKPIRGEVKYYTQSFKISCPKQSPYGWKFLRGLNKRWEIIGNIHDNPELLKDEVER